MQSAPLPEFDDEVVEVFKGDSLEEAMAYAVATLGPDLTVRRARKLRKGVQGLRGKETYEVAALPAPRVSDDAVGDAFAALLHEAEKAEEAQEEPAPPTPRVRRTVRPTSPPPLPPVLQPAPKTPPLAVQRELLAEPAAVMATVPTRPTAAARRTPARAATTARSSARAAAPSPVPGAPDWSRARLTALGLPRRVLAALPAKAPGDDVGWIAALAAAIATAMPAPAPADTAHPVVVDGYGVAGVLGLLKAARSGMTPGTITADGRRAPATPTELALVVRAALVG